MYGDGYVGTGADASRGRMLEKERQAMFSGTSEQKQREIDITNAYRLKKTDDKFASTTSATESLLIQQTVGLQSKEEYARKKRELEEGGGASSAAAPAAAAEPTKEKKKKKAKASSSALSFDMDDGDDGEGDEVELLKKKPKKTPTVVFEPKKDAESASAAAAAAAAAASAAASSSSGSQQTVTPLPEGHTCIKQVPGEASALELALEVFASSSAPRTKITAIAAHAIAVTVKGTERGGEANKALCGFLKSVLGGDAVSADVTRGFNAPVKVVTVGGVDGVDLAHHRLLMAQKYIH